MKILLLAILLFPLLLLGQPVKNDKKIIVTVDTANVYSKIVSELFDKGYSVETKDDGLKFIVSTEKNFGSWSLKIRSRVKDSSIVFTGQIASNVTLSISGVKVERTFGDLSYYTGAFAKGSDYRKAWDVLELFAKQFGDKIRYEK